MEHPDYLSFALDLARDAGAIMRQNFMLGMRKEWKSDATPLTETDTKIHTLVCNSIMRAFPTHAVLSEESGEDGALIGAKGSEYVWVCDPIDGTHNFGAGIPTATFMLTLVHDGVPMLAVINDPFMERLFYAEKGKGAFMNGKEIHVSDAPVLKHTIVALGKVNAQLMALYGTLREQRGVRVITGLSIGYVGALVAAGELSACVFSGRDPHDTAALQLLVEEAGGMATDLAGVKSARYDGKVNGQIASNGHVHADLVALLSEHAN